MTKAHQFHIPVMGVAFTIDTPLKVSQYGIDSVISIIDNYLLEKLRKMYCDKYEFPYDEITDKAEDFRAQRVTSYLNLIKKIADKKFEDLKNTAIDKSKEIKDYFNMLPDYSVIKQEFNRLTADYFDINKIRSWLSDNLSMGSIDVNIMTKLDKENYINNEKLPVEFNNAHAALRGYANSDLESSIILSAGMNPRLYGYMELFEDFYPKEDGSIKKKIVLKVSDFRSAIIQGKFLAKKGLWVHEYRIESGLNCGGHAFASDGLLLGPILSEFKKNQEELFNSTYKLFVQALIAKNKTVPEKKLPLKITAQGGVGTNEEHQFLIDYYQIDSVGWGTPFLLVPEVSNLDDQTRKQLIEAKEDDLYLSTISPLGIPFNNLRNNSKDVEKLELIKNGIPGSPCPKKYITYNTEFTEKAICVSSRQYQKLKIEELDKQNLPPEKYKKKFDKITAKACVCTGLGASILIMNNINSKSEGDTVSICPGPNMAYFSKIMNLKELVDHIYGKSNVISRTDRPNMFTKELNIYIDFLRNKFEDISDEAVTAKQKKYLLSFAANIQDGIDYYNHLFNDLKETFKDTKDRIINDLELNSKSLTILRTDLENISITES